MNDIERRGSRRLPLTLQVFWTADGRGVEEAETGDLSEEGCFLMSSFPAEVGADVDMRTQLSTGVWLHLQGAVTHRMEVGFGVRFRLLPAAARRALADLLESHYEKNRELGSASTPDPSEESLSS